jgi:methylase of polypeptide subunit release factors
MQHLLPQIFSFSQPDFQFLYVEGTDSGGFAHKDRVNSVIKRTGLKQRYNHAHEWCCGHGAMGFNLLIDGICSKVTLSDVDHLSMLGCQFTVAANSMQDKVNTFLIEEFTDIPIPDEPWDLIITNPPYVPDLDFYEQQGRRIPDRAKTMWIDPDWVAHKNFFANVKKYIDSECDIYIFGLTEFIGEQIELAQINGFKFVQKYDDLKVPNSETQELLHFRPA